MSSNFWLYFYEPKYKYVTTPCAPVTATIMHRIVMVPRRTELGWRLVTDRTTFTIQLIHLCKSPKVLNDKLPQFKILVLLTAMLLRSPLLFAEVIEATMVSVLAALLIPSTRRPGATYEKPRNNSCAVALGGTPGESKKLKQNRH